MKLKKLYYLLQWAIIPRGNTKVNQQALWWQNVSDSDGWFYRVYGTLTGNRHRVIKQLKCVVCGGTFWSRAKKPYPTCLSPHCYLKHNLNKTEVRDVAKV